MNSKPSVPAPTLMEELKAQTAEVHARLEGSPYFVALAAAQLQLESYVGHLRAFAMIFGVLEPALRGCADPRVASVWTPDMAKLPRLHQDLRYFEPRVVADLREPTETALEIAEWLRRLSLEEPLGLLGAAYVLEGSTLGGAVLRPLVARCFHLVDDEGLAYLGGDHIQGRWREFQRRVNDLGLEGEERSQAVHAANCLFQRLEKLFHGLHPFRPESKTFLATSINPEAGRHAVPADPAEIEAALRAGDSCWEEFPYFEWRYGERGRRFARSDAAWKATLCRYEPDQILQQIRWLGRVLAGRGMPTWLLEAQLVVLVRELATANPAKSADYEKLLPAAAELRAERGRRLDDESLARLADEFDQAVGPEWSARLPRTGRLLGCAVADELNGSGLAVESLRSWLVDPARFPAPWIAAVEATIAQARKLARNPA